MSPGDGIPQALHELRGPLGAVRLGIELGLHAGSLSQRRLRSLELELGRALLALRDLERLLASGEGQGARRGGGDATTTRREPVELRRLLQDSAGAWRPAAGSRRVLVEVPRPGGAAAPVLGERLRLAQAVGNLIANAIEHGAGTIRVRLRTVERTARVEVQDEGAGLPAPLHALLRGQGHHGLRVADRVAFAHGGRLLSAPSERGARLVLELPVVAARAEWRAARG